MMFFSRFRNNFEITKLNEINHLTDFRNQMKDFSENHLISNKINLTSSLIWRLAHFFKKAPAPVPNVLKKTGKVLLRFAERHAV
jgi:hypothetical protein